MVDARDFVKMGVLSLRDWERFGKAVKKGPGGGEEEAGLARMGGGEKGDLPFQEERRRRTEVGIIAASGQYLPLQLLIAAVCDVCC